MSTSLGALYVRHTRVSDWKNFGSDSSAELGRAAVQGLVSRVQDKRDCTPLTGEDVDALLNSDFAMLAPVIAERSGWGELPPGAGLDELGDAVKRGRDQEAMRHQKMQDDMRKSIGSSYAFLEKTTLEKLQEQMKGLVGIRQSMSAVESLNAAMGPAGSFDRSLRDVLSATHTVDDALRKLNSNAIFSGIEPPQSIETSRMPALLRPEDTVLGKATLESAENSRESVQRMDALVEVIGGLNQTLVKDVLPAWFKQVESGQQHSERSFRQAGKSLTWTQWAVVASVGVSIAATGWQISVARDIDRENSVAQRTTESLLREQLVAQQKLAEQQALQAEQLRQLFEKQLRDTEKLRELLEPKLPAPSAR
ncbi:hypothetical protein FQZ97_809520 [compost metagenome]